MAVELQQKDTQFKAAAKVS